MTARGIGSSLMEVDPPPSVPAPSALPPSSPGEVEELHALNCSQQTQQLHQHLGRVNSEFSEQVHALFV